MDTKTISVIIGLFILTISTCYSDPTDLNNLDSYKHIYQRKHIIRMFNDEQWTASLATDNIAYTIKPNNSLDFEIETVGTNGHSCWVKANALQIDAHYLHRKIFKKIDQEFECRLMIYLHDETAELIDSNNACKLYYCGVKAKLNGGVFTKKETNPECRTSYKHPALSYSIYTCNDKKNIIIEAMTGNGLKRLLLNNKLANRHRNGDNLIDIARRISHGASLRKQQLIDVTQSLPQSIFK